jgi:hypothetical protein
MSTVDNAVNTRICGNGNTSRTRRRPTRSRARHQIADGENGGVMMNEFPFKYFEVVRECSNSRTPLMNVTEYLETLHAMGILEADLPVLRPLFQARIWDRLAPGDGPQRLGEVIDDFAPRGRTLPHGWRQLDERLIVAVGIRSGARADGESEFTLPRAGAGERHRQRRSALPQRALPLCSSRKRAVTATGARESGPLSAANAPGARARFSRASCSATFLGRAACRVRAVPDRGSRRRGRSVPRRRCARSA